VHEQIGEHYLWHLPVLGAVHADTIVTTWLVMLLSLGLFAWIGASYRTPYLTKRHAIAEGVINYIADLATQSLGPAGEAFIPFYVALFIFIFLLNQFGMIPFKAVGLPFGGSPTADINTVLPLALIVFFMIQFVALRAKGLPYFRHLLKPFWWLAPINTLEELVRPITLCARLFFNIFVCELLFIIVASVVVAHVKIGAFDLSLSVTFVPFLIQFFNFFVGTVQAFVFTLLAIVYMSLAIAEDH
jgi:F-type H+-transporting ATPase subunit a